eukprot:scaffold1224_cov191-Pinguiococcus_pyrenoidosus.AAC.4
MRSQGRGSRVVRRGVIKWKGSRIEIVSKAGMKLPVLGLRASSRLLDLEAFDRPGKLSGREHSPQAT